MHAMYWTSALILGAAQGLTEFLPVSSDGHLTLLEHFLPGMQPNLAFNVFLHWATALALLVYFRRDVGRLIQGFIMSFVPMFRARSIRPILRDEWMTMPWLIVLGTIPTIPVALLLKHASETTFSALPWVALFEAITGLWILLSVRVSRTRQQEAGSVITVGQALLLGFIQGIAVLPGISRSASTVGLALMLGIMPQKAARFSFYLGLPAIFGAGLLELPELFAGGALGGEAWLAFVASFVFGLLGIHLLLRSVQSRWFAAFGVYCLLLGAVVGWSICR